MAKLDDTANGVMRATRSEDDSSIRPFVFHLSDEELANLHRRIAATR